MNIDIEVMVLTLGIQKAAQVLETSEEALHVLMGEFSPNNQKFFLFIKDCLLSYIKKVGNKSAEERLGISSYVLDRILTSEATFPIKRPRVTEIIDYRKIGENKDLSHFSAAFKKKVLKFYNNYHDVDQTANKFSLAKELILAWVKDDQR
ncbi:hypothetical protein SteCoe_24493 [Stentor coeruleus]|uniref:Uncharacterized protein n=1 Tax=Stentor coeruleus TaxID=5963 RepID=A0A1R2BHE4_9CILI|nr:hypothetical protein SteCoe_24493 [Stentor coeruleus]